MEHEAIASRAGGLDLRARPRSRSQSLEMPVIMVVLMTLHDEAWTQAYFQHVPAILAEYGAVSVAGSREITRLEGVFPVPDRMAVLSFPSMDAVDRFMADERYQAFRRSREGGAASEIFAFPNAVAAGELV